MKTSPWLEKECFKIQIFLKALWALFNRPSQPFLMQSNKTQDCSWRLWLDTILFLEWAKLKLTKHRPTDMDTEWEAVQDIINKCNHLQVRCKWRNKKWKPSIVLHLSDFQRAELLKPTSPVTRMKNLQRTSCSKQEPKTKTSQPKTQLQRLRPW